MNVKEIRLGDLFVISNSKGVNANQVKFGGSYPYVTRTEKDNGIAGYIYADNLDKINPANTISFGQDTWTLFYQSEPYFTGNRVKILKLKDENFKLTEEVALYLITAMKKVLVGLTWGTSKNEVNFENRTICLPVTSSGEIDWQYMQERIAELEQERIAELEQERIAELEHYLVASGLNDYELTEDDKSILATELFNSDDATELPSENGCRKEARKFRVGDLFEKVNPRFYGKPNTYIGRKSCTTTEPDATHTIPLTCAKHDNNGVMYYGNSNLFESVANCLVMIRDGAVSTGLVFAHEDPVGVLSHSYLMKCKDDVSFRSLLYVSSVMTKTLYPRYNRSDPSYWDGKVENDRILLPVTYDGLPDWSFMEKYIRAVEKVVIKDVVDWKDEEIKKTKEIVS